MAVLRSLSEEDVISESLKPTLRDRLRAGLRAVGDGVVLAARSLAGVLLVSGGAVVACLTLLGFGVYLVRPVLTGLRALANASRLTTFQFPEVTEPYPAGAFRAGLAGLRRVGTDPATHRDLRWAAADWPVGVTLGLLPALMIAGGLWGLATPLTWQWVTGAWNGSWFLFVPLVSHATAALSAVLGLVMIGAGVLLAPLLRDTARAWSLRLTMRSINTVLAERVAHLAQTRAQALDAQQSEIRRIERDLHDGAQARLTAMGMTLKLMEKSLESNPAAVPALLGQAQADSRRAMQELRDLVHGIHPPVLADRGLVDAVRALALECGVPAAVESTLTGRLAEPIESALYFAVSELVTNAVKHADAARISIGLRPEHGWVQVTVSDDGRGGADPDRGTGMAGVRRRLAAFDGTLTVQSPPGGPSTITLRVPV